MAALHGANSRDIFMWYLIVIVDSILSACPVAPMCSAAKRTPDLRRYYFNGKPTETVVLHCADGQPTSGESWEIVENFPAGFEPPPGAHPTEWDADGDR